MSEWIKVQQRMPGDTKSVLVWCPERKNTYSAYWVAPYWYFFGGSGIGRGVIDEKVTHWTPKPDPPAEGAVPDEISDLTLSLDAPDSSRPSRRYFNDMILEAYYRGQKSAEGQ